MSNQHYMLLSRAKSAAMVTKFQFVSHDNDPGSCDHTGAFGARVTPVPIPNTAVKTRSGDDTLTMGKVARCRTD